MPLAILYNGPMNDNTQTEIVPGSDSPDVTTDAAGTTGADNIEQLRAWLNKANKESAERNVALKAQKAELDALKAAQAQAAEKTAAEQGEYQKLWEAEKKRAEAEAQRAAELEGRIRAQELAMMRQRIAGAKGLPPALAERLQGETEEEITADADALLKALPLPAAAGLDGGARGNGQVVDSAAAKRILSTYNIDPRYLAD